MNKDNATSKKSIYRMSSAGDCPRALSAEHLGYPVEPVPDWLERAAEEGKRHEQWIKEELTKQGILVHDDQQELAIEFPLFTLVGHIDGIVTEWDTQVGINRDRLLEIKSMSQYEFDRWMKDKWSGFGSYAAQITCYMKGTKLSEVMYLIKNRSSGYIDKAILTEPPANFDEIVNKLNRVESCVSIGVLAEAEYLPDSVQCRRCFYKTLCIPAPTEYKAVPEIVLLGACEKWRQGQLMMNEGDQLVKEAKEIFLNQTEVSGQKKWRFDELFISKIEVKESATYKKAKLLEIFTEEQLKPASEIKLPYNYLKIEDLRKEE